MLEEAFSSSNDSFLHSQFSTGFLPFFQNMHCYITKPSSFVFITTSIANIVIPLPIMIYILHHGVEQWRQKASAASVTHTDVFTFHMAIIELIGVFSYIPLLFVSITNTEVSNMLSVGSLVSVFHWYGQIFFHILTCLERYLAVVHPITYLNLRNKRGIRIRNIITGCMWLLSFVGMGLKMTKSFIIADFCFYGLPLLVILFFSVSVLCVLIRPGPKSGGRERSDQSKQRAFYTIVAILGVLTLRFMGSLLWKLVFMSVISNGCLIMASVSWFGLPSSLVLPLLFLNRAGKLVCCKNNV